EYAVLGWGEGNLYGTRIFVASGETRMIKKEDLRFKEKVSTVAKGGEPLSAVDKTAGTLKNAITVDPLSMLYNNRLSIGYERATARKLSFFIRLPEFRHVGSSGTFTNVDTGTTEALQGSTTEFGISGGLRFFILGEAPRGLWLSPEVGLGYVALKWTRFDSLGNSQGDFSGGEISFRVAASVGYTFVFGPI